MACGAASYGGVTNAAGRGAHAPAAGRPSWRNHLAEEAGFEPASPCGPAVFKTAAFSLSATPPGGDLARFLPRTSRTAVSVSIAHSTSLLVRHAHRCAGDWSHLIAASPSGCARRRPDRARRG